MLAAAPFLALLTIAMLLLAALRLELDFRRTENPRPEPRNPRPQPGSPRPELRTSPAGGYCQAPFPAAAFGRG
jgi:hypothetical protein